MEHARLIDGPGSELWETVTRLVRCGRMSADLGKMIRQPGGEERAVRAMLREFFPPAPDEPLPKGSIVLPKPVKVDRRKSLADMIREARLDNERDALGQITEERFPVYRSWIIQNGLVYEKELILLAPYEDEITTRQWWDWMDGHELIREETPELMALARDFPDYQREFYIPAFGSSWRNPNGSLRSPALWGGDGERKADAYWYGPGYRWHLLYRALVSRKRRR